MKLALPSSARASFSDPVVTPHNGLTPSSDVNLPSQNELWGLVWCKFGHAPLQHPGTKPAYSGVTLNVARPDMNNYATLGVMLY